jgi:hypothetical protein
LDGVSIHPVTTAVLPNSVAGEEGNCSRISPLGNGDFKTVTKFNGCGRRMDQQHCSYSTILTILRVKEGSLYRI